MDKKMQVRVLLAVGAFLTCWQAADFAVDFKVVMSALVAGFFGFAKPTDKVADTLGLEDAAVEVDEG